MLQPLLGHILLIHKQHIAAAKHSAIAIVHRVNRGVVLIVTAQRNQAHHVVAVNAEVLMDAFEHREHRFAGRRRPDPLGWRQRHTETARMTNTFVIILEPGDSLLDEIADAVVISHQR